MCKKGTSIIFTFQLYFRSIHFQPNQKGNRKAPFALTSLSAFMKLYVQLI